MMTLTFLPVSAVATIFGSQFFTISTDDVWANSHFRVHPIIWVFCATSLLLTVAVVLGWWLLSIRRKGRFFGVDQLTQLRRVMRNIWN
jgi:hypothetical protein